MNVIKYIVFILIMPGITTISGCSEKADPELKAELERRGKRWLDVDFVQAVEEGDTELVELYLKAGKDPDTRKGYKNTGKNETVLMIAAKNGNKEMMEVLISSGADIKLRQKRGPSRPVHWAAEYGHMDIVKWLLEQGETLDGDPEVLIWTASNGQPEMVKYLLESGIPVNNRTANGEETALMKAAKNGFHEVVRVLIEKGADINAVNKTNETALLLACNAKETEKWEYYPKIVKLLVENGANLNVLSSVKKETALMRAVQSQNRYVPDGQVIIHILLDYGADPKVKGTNGRTILHHIADYSSENDEDFNTLKILIDGGADLNITEDEWGWTPMMLAIQKGNSGIAKILLEAGADPSIKDIDGNTALVIARRTGNTEIIDLLEE